MERLAKKLGELGEGEVVVLSSGERLFKLSSYEGNPVVRPQDLGLVWKEGEEEKVGAVFNGGAELLNDRIVLLPRCHRDYRPGKFFDEKLGIERVYLENYISEVWPLESEDGASFTRVDDVVIKGDGSEHSDFSYGIEDIRVVKTADRYLLIGCGKVKPPFRFSNADRIAVYSTTDFRTITYHGIVKSFDSRNAVPFPEPVNGVHYILLRFYPNIHIATLKGGIEQLLRPDEYESEWKRLYEEREKSLLFSTGDYPHEKEKLGPGTQLIKTDRGWLMLYHAVGEVVQEVREAYGVKEEIPRGYSVCAALLDLDDPQRVIARTRTPIYIPNAPYELSGSEEYPVDVPAVVFPVGAFTYGDKLLVYAGAADKYTVLLSVSLEKLVDYLVEYCPYRG